jgi:hypothetical protein
MEPAELNAPAFGAAIAPSVAPAGGVKVASDVGLDDKKLPARAAAKRHTTRPVIARLKMTGVEVRRAAAGERSGAG